MEACSGTESQSSQSPLRPDRTEIERQQERYSSELAAMRTNVEALTAELSKKTSEAQSAARMAETKRQVVEAELTVVKDTKEALLKANAALEERNEHLKMSNAFLLSKIDELENHILHISNPPCSQGAYADPGDAACREALEAASARLEAALSETREEVLRLRREMAVERNLREASECEVAELHAAVERKSREVDEISERVGNFERQANIAETEVARLHRELSVREHEFVAESEISICHREQISMCLFDQLSLRTREHGNSTHSNFQHTMEIAKLKSELRRLAERIKELVAERRRSVRSEDIRKLQLEAAELRLQLFDKENISDHPHSPVLKRTRTDSPGGRLAASSDAEDCRQQ
jgi:hypothetical protein